MLKNVIFGYLLMGGAFLSAADSGTLSASLYYHISHEVNDKENTKNLHCSLISQLIVENAPEKDIQMVVDQFNHFQNGEDVRLEARELWLKLTSEDTSEYRRLKNHPVIGSKEARTIKPWLLPKNHPMKTPLDTIFTASRALKDKHTFAAAGFDTFKVQPRSFIRVARHPALPGYLVKIYLDDEQRLKRNRQGWHWFAKRCEGAKRIAKIIKNKKIKHFKVAGKWIYPLPAKPKAPSGSEYSPKGEILLVEDMHIVSNSKSREAWKTVMRKAHLNELYTIIAYGKGSSYRPDNIPYSIDGKFAFIDTEYPDTEPNFATPIEYFSAEMRTYWRQLIKQGGP